MLLPKEGSAPGLVVPFWVNSAIEPSRSIAGLEYFFLFVNRRF